MSIIQPRDHDTLLPGVSPRMQGSIIAEEEGTWLKETASQTFGVDDFVYIDTSLGTVSICTTSTNQMNSPIAGLAGQKASGVTGNPVLLRVIRRDTVLRMNVWHSTAASAVAAQATLGNVYAIFNSASAQPTGTNGAWAVDIENFANIEDATHALARVQVVGFYQGRVFTNATPSVEVDADYVHDIYGFVLVKVLPFSIASDGTPFTRGLKLGRPFARETGRGKKGRASALI